MKKIITLSILLLFVLYTAACGKTTTTKSDNIDTNNSDKPSGEELAIGILPAESAIPIILAKENGYFDKEGVNVSIKAFSAPTDRNVAIQANELDGTIADVMTAAAFMENGIKMKITSDISEDFKILSSPNSGITKMKELNGKNISLVPNFILEYIMDDFAAKEDFTYNIVEIPSFSGRAEALIADKVDGVVFTEPQASMLVSQGANLLGSSTEASIKGGTILFSEEIISSKPADIKAFYKAYNKAIDYMNTTKAEEYGDILTKYQFPDAMSKYLATKESFPYANVVPKDSFDSIVQWTKDKGQITKIYSYEELTDFTFLPN
ncbi:ABC transporter substrate-binding protein [Niallia sp. FSL W8-0635]|uniref:ABC transporter substrate-binding protein n=1 Tax=Niallia sp. FSL W8-0635 TaxID=2975337 RepID=UPI002B01693B|nr:ABC transporter substrate-binding protein [Yersinia enterocolitica]